MFSLGGVARELRVSPSTVRKWERLGLIEPAMRLEGSDRRIYAVSDVEAIKARVALRRREPQEEEAPMAR